MGTSKGYTPPTGYLWTDAKRNVTQMIKEQASDSSVGKAVSSYMKAANNNGGYSTKRNTISLIASRALEIISGVQTVGLEQTLKYAGLSQLIGKSYEEIIVGLVNYFTDTGSTIDEAVAKDCMAELITEIFILVDENYNLEDIFKSIKKEEFIFEYILKCLQKDFLKNFAEKILFQCKDMNEVVSMQEKIKDFIKIYLETNYTSTDISKIDWNSNEGKDIISVIYDDTVNVFLMWGDSND